MTHEVGTRDLIAAVALPYAAWITEASPERPYLGFVLKLDPTVVGSVLVEVGHAAGAGARAWH